MACQDKGHGAIVNVAWLRHANARFVAARCAAKSARRRYRFRAIRGRRRKSAQNGSAPTATTSKKSMKKEARPPWPSATARA